MTETNLSLGDGTPECRKVTEDLPENDIKTNRSCDHSSSVHYNVDASKKTHYVYPFQVHLRGENVTSCMYLLKREHRKRRICQLVITSIT